MGKFQSQVRFRQGYGVVGEISHDGPLRAKPGVLNSEDEKDNVWGRVFTLNDDGETVRAGGSGFFWGILANPKTDVFTGRIGDDSAQAFAPNGVVSEFVEMGEINVLVDGPVDYGAKLGYRESDGVIVLMEDSTREPESTSEEADETPAKAADESVIAIPNASISRVRQLLEDGGIVSLRLTN